MARQRKLTEERKKLINQLLSTDQPEDAGDVQSMLKDLLGDTLQGMLEVELEDDLGYSKYDYTNQSTDNRRNGYSKKTVTSSMGDLTLDIPRDREGGFEPQVVKKHQTDISSIEDQVMSMYAKGMTTRDITEHLQRVYGVDASPTMISKMTDKILPIAKEWQNRPLANKYAIVFMDGIHYNVRQDNTVIKKAVYIAIGIKLDGTKEMMGMWIGGNDSAKYWLGVLNEIKNRGTEDIALQQLEALDNKWGKKYPSTIRSWQNNWTDLTTYFKYPPELRKLIYTTNAIENFNRQLRKVTQSKSIFPTDDALFKMLYLAMTDITAKWKGRPREWTRILEQLFIYFEGRISLSDVE